MIDSSVLILLFPQVLDQGKLKKQSSSHSVTVSMASEPMAAPVEAQHLQWQMRPSMDYADHSQLLDADVDSKHWLRAGPCACQRLTRVWCEGDESAFFVTVAPCVSVKWRIYKWFGAGMVLERAAAPSEEVMVCRPNPDQPVACLQVDVERTSPCYVHCTIYKMSGVEIMNEEMPVETTWWHLSRHCYKHTVSTT